jgi:hypothetical protein
VGHIERSIVDTARGDEQLDLFRSKDLRHDLDRKLVVARGDERVRRENAAPADLVEVGFVEARRLDVRRAPSTNTT